MNDSSNTLPGLPDHRITVLGRLPDVDEVSLYDLAENPYGSLPSEPGEQGTGPVIIPQSLIMLKGWLYMLGTESGTCHYIGMTTSHLHLRIKGHLSQLPIGLRRARIFPYRVSGWHFPDIPTLREIERACIESWRPVGNGTYLTDRFGRPVGMS